MDRVSNAIWVEDVCTLQVKNSIAYLILNSPPKNEMTLHFFNVLSHNIKNILPNLDITGMIIHGKGRHFSSGANVTELCKAIGSSPDNSSFQDISFLQENHQVFSILAQLPYPVVAAVNGCCFGVGLELALLADIIIASPHAVFCLPESSFGLMPGCGGTIRLAQRLSFNKMIELILTGRSVLAEEALSMGLIDIMVNKNEVLNKAKEMIRCMKSV